MFLLLKTFPGDKPSPILQVEIVLQVLLVLDSRHGWLVLFLLVLVEGELQLHMLVDRVGLAHLPTLVLLMAGAQWILRDCTEGPPVPLKV
jgi:hypothetical protein